MKPAKRQIDAGDVYRIMQSYHASSGGALGNHLGVLSFLQAHTEFLSTMVAVSQKADAAQSGQSPFALDLAFGQEMLRRNVHVKALTSRLVDAFSVVFRESRSSGQAVSLARLRDAFDATTLHDVPAVVQAVLQDWEAACEQFASLDYLEELEMATRRIEHLKNQVRTSLCRQKKRSMLASVCGLLLAGLVSPLLFVLKPYLARQMMRLEAEHKRAWEVAESMSTWLGGLMTPERGVRFRSEELGVTQPPPLYAVMREILIREALESMLKVVSGQVHDFANRSVWVDQ